MRNDESLSASSWPVNNKSTNPPAPPAPLPQTSLGERGANLFVVVLLALSVGTLLGCSSKENLLDSFSKKKREQNAAVNSPEEQPEEPTQKASASPVEIADDLTPTPPKHFSEQSFREAAARGDGPTVAAAIESGVNVNTADETGTTALMLAAYDGHTDIVKLLIKHKAQVNRVDVNKRTALIYSASGKNPGTVAELIDAGAKVDLVDGGEGWSALMFAAAEGNPEVVKILLANGADPKRGDIDGEDSMYFAARGNRAGHVEVVTLLKAAIESKDQ